MAARQLRTRRAPSSQKFGSEPPIFIPLDSSAKAEQQPPSSQQQRTPRYREAPGKEPVTQLAQEDFPNQRREAHQGRRAERQPPSFQQQRTPQYREAPGKEPVTQLAQEDFPNQRREAHQGRRAEWQPPSFQQQRTPRYWEAPGKERVTQLAQEDFPNQRRQAHQGRRAEQQPPSFQQQRTPRYQKAPSKEHETQLAQEDFLNQHREVDQGRRADQREALGLKVERERGSSRPSQPKSDTQALREKVEMGTESGREPQPDLKAPSDTDVGQRLRDTYNDVAGEVTSAKILKQPDSSTSPKEQSSSSRSSMRQKRSSQDHSADTSTSNRNGSRGEMHGYQQPGYGRRNIDRSSRGARGAEETSGSSFQRRSEAAQPGAGIRNQWDDGRERNSRQEDTLQNRNRQVA